MDEKAICYMTAVTATAAVAAVPFVTVALGVVLVAAVLPPPHAVTNSAHPIASAVRSIFSGFMAILLSGLSGKDQWLKMPGKRR